MRHRPLGIILAGMILTLPGCRAVLWPPRTWTVIVVIAVILLFILAKMPSRRP